LVSFLNIFKLIQLNIWSINKMDQEVVQKIKTFSLAYEQRVLCKSLKTKYQS
jgi:hypothetical protein